jgi:hypothetical protein
MLRTKHVLDFAIEVDGLPNGGVISLGFECPSRFVVVHVFVSMLFISIDSSWLFARISVLNTAS